MDNEQNGVSDLTGQVAIVTGGGRGIGRAIAIDLAAAGASVAVVARSGDQIAEAAEEIKRAGGRAVPVPADVSDPEAVGQMVREVEQALGPIDVLVNNAGLPGPIGPTWEADPEDWWLPAGRGGPGFGSRRPEGSSPGCAGRASRTSWPQWARSSPGGPSRAAEPTPRWRRSCRAAWMRGSRPTTSPSGSRRGRPRHRGAGR